MQRGGRRDRGDRRVPARLLAATCVVSSCLVALPGRGRAEDAPGADLRREVEALRAELRAMQAQVKHLTEANARQEAVIRRLGAGQAAPPAPAAEPSRTAAAPAPAAPSPPSPASAPPAPPWSPTQPLTLVSGGRAYLNLSFDSLTDFGWSTRSDVTAIERGDHDPLQRGFTLPNEEIFLDGAVDPYFKGVADIVFKLDKDNATDVELEEVYLMTTSLPWNLQAKAGQFFSEFGRLNTQHPHAWDFVDQPLVIGRMFGPEGLRNPGARLSWLVPTPFYSEVFLAAQDSQADTAFSFRNTDDALFGRPPIDRPVRNPGDLLYVPRYAASFDPTDAQTLVVGLSGAFGPNASGRDTRTQIYGGDVYWKWKPAWQSGGFPFVSWQTEALGRRYEAGAVPADAALHTAALPSETLYDYGVYSQVVYGFTQRWTAGLRGDWVTGDHGAFAPDPNRAERFRLSPDVTFYPTEFSKLRLQYNYDHGRLLGDDSSVWLQVEFLLGAHAAHKF
jgi:hypothetical protein